MSFESKANPALNEITLITLTLGDKLFSDEVMREMFFCLYYCCYLAKFIRFHPVSVCFVFCEGTRFEVPVENGLDEDKALEILALYVNGKPQKLPDQARSIVSECKGTTRFFLC